jgi:hypothetical protein
VKVVDCSNYSAYIHKPLAVVLGWLACAGSAREVILKFIPVSKSDEIFNPCAFNMRASGMVKVLHFDDLFSKSFS